MILAFVETWKPEKQTSLLVVVLVAIILVLLLVEVLTVVYFLRFHNAGKLNKFKPDNFSPQTSKSCNQYFIADNSSKYFGRSKVKTDVGEPQPSLPIFTCSATFLLYTFDLMS